MYHANVNLNLMKKNLVQVSGRIMMNVDVIVKDTCMGKDYIWDIDACSCGNLKYLVSIVIVTRNNIVWKYGP